MKFFANKKFFQKIIIAILIVMSFSFIFSCNVEAKSDGMGGKLLKPIVSLLSALGDGIMDVIHNGLIHQDSAYIRVDLTNSIWNAILTIGAMIVGAVILGVAVYFTAGVAVPAIVNALGGTVVAGVTAGVMATAIVSGAVIGGAIFNSNVLSDDLILPLYAITPEEIFSGNLAVFDVDFFNPNTDKEVVNTSTQELDTESCSGIQDAVDKIKSKYKITVNANDIDFGNVSDGSTARQRVGTANGKGVYVVLVKGTTVIGQPGNTQPDRIYIGVSKNSETSDYASIAYKLRPTVASWYKTLRNLAIVGSLSILIYIAIRIIISSSSADKSKYKQRLYDWLISICLIFIMHYIMAGSNIFVDKLSGLLNSVQKPMYVPVVVLEGNDKEKMVKALEENKDALISHNIISENGKIEDLFTQQEGKDTLIWPTNLMGIVRMYSQKVKQESSVAYAGYTIMFMVLVIFTVSFTFTYLRRILYLAFLTIIAPCVAMTYALDKLKDGSAQGFNNWFKEYMVNLLIQPIHLLLYTVLVSSAIELAESNLVYGIVAIGFMMPAEKLVRRFFGISATETQGLLAGPAGAALVMTGVNKLLAHRPAHSHNNGPQNDKEMKDKINYKDSLDTNEIFNDSNNTNGSGDGDNNAGNGVPMKGEPMLDTDIPTQQPGDAPNIPPTNDNINQDAWLQAEAQEDAWNIDSNSNESTETNDNIQTNHQTSQTPINTQPKRPIKRPEIPKTNTSQPDSSSKNQNKTNRKRSLWNGIRRGAKFYGRGLGKNMANAINRGDPARKMLSFAGGLGTAALTGGIGLAAGIASGDLSKTAQYTAGAALGGHMFGSSVSNWATGALDVPNAGEYFARGYYGDQEYEERERDKIVKRMKKERMNDEFIRDFSLRTDMTEKEAKNYLEQDNFLEEGLKYGFSDANEFATAKMAKDDLGDQKKAFAHTKMVKDYGSDINRLENDRKAKDSYLRALADRFSVNMERDEKGNVKDKEALDNSVNALYRSQLRYSKEYYKK